MNTIIVSLSAQQAQIKNMKKSHIKFLVGVLLFYLFTQIQWAKMFFPTKHLQNEEIDNTALFYTESEEATEAEFLMKQK
jgi:hypothetical protein